MVLSKQKDSLYDPVRKLRVPNTPEEEVRQKLLHKMLYELGYPLALLAVEKRLSECCCSTSNLPNRRLDLVCFEKMGSDIVPLLLVECKKDGMSEKGSERQALGYNWHLGASFVAIASCDGERLIFPKEMDALPSFSKLLEWQWN